MRLHKLHGTIAVPWNLTAAGLQLAPVKQQLEDSELLGQGVL